MLAGAIGAAANFGFLFISVVSRLAPATQESWRWMMLVGAAPALLVVFIRLAVPESERWKAAVRAAAAKPIREIFSPALRKITLLAIVFASIPLIGTWAAVSGWVPPWAGQLAEKPLVDLLEGRVIPPIQERLADRDLTADAPAIPEEERAAFAHLTQLTAKRLAENGQTAALLKENRVTDEQLKRLIEAQLAGEPATRQRLIELRRQAAPAGAMTQLMLSIGAIVGCFVAPLVGGKIGRRPAYFGLCLLSLVACAFLFRALDTYDTLFLVTVLVTGCVTAAFYGWLPLYLPELFPTRVRATGQGLSFNFGRVLAAVGALQMGQLVGLLGGSYAKAGATITLIYILGLGLIWLAPETKGRPLPE
jgi:MFS family permease